MAEKPKRPSNPIVGGGAKPGQASRPDETPSDLKHLTPSDTSTEGCENLDEATPSDQSPGTIWGAATGRARSNANLVTERTYTVEQRARAKAEWLLGAKNPGQIAEELGIKSRGTIYAWADEEGWPARGSARPSITQAINESLIRETANDLRSRAAAAETAEDAELAARLSSLGLDADEQEPADQQLVQEYALAVTEVIRSHQRQSRTVVDIGDNLIAMYHAATQKMRQAFDRMPADKKAGVLARAELISKTAGQFATLVRALQVAHKMQRDAHDLQPGAAPPGDTPSKGDAPSSDGPAMPGSYEEVLREMEKRGMTQ